MKLHLTLRRVHGLPDHVRFVHSAHINYLTNHPSAIENVPSRLNLEGKEVVPPLKFVQLVIR